MNSLLLSSMLSLLLISNNFSVVSSITSVKVKLHDAATLHCNHTCSGLVTWTVFHEPRDILARCDQTSCQSEEGFHMSHDQYLKGDLSLTITDVDYNKRTMYTCECDDVEICDVSLQIEGTMDERDVYAEEGQMARTSIHRAIQVWVVTLVVVVVIVVIVVVLLVALAVVLVRWWQRRQQCSDKMENTNTTELIQSPPCPTTLLASQN